MAADLKDAPRCIATAKGTGKQCKRRPIPGGTVCRMHGGASPQVRAAADRRLQEERARVLAATLGTPVEVDPHTALLQELHTATGEVAWLGFKVSELDPDAVVWGTVRQTHGAQQDEGESSKVVKQAGVSIWVKLWHEARDRKSAAARNCISAGIEERRLQMEEAAGQQLASVVRAVLDRMMAAVLAAVLETLSEEQAREVLRRAFEAAWASNALVIVPEEFRRLGDAPSDVPLA